MHSAIILLTGLVITCFLCNFQCKADASKSLRGKFVDMHNVRRNALNEQSRDYASLAKLLRYAKRSNPWKKEFTSAQKDEVTLDQAASESKREIDYTRPIESSTCGRQQISPALSERIYGGTHAVANSWPWQVLFEEESICYSFFTCTSTCGGTLLNENYVLTAAHCVESSNVDNITITAGLHNRELNEEEETTRQKRKVSAIFIHPDWKSDTIENDLAILKLAEPVKFNEYVHAACLPGPDPVPGSTVVLIGWGAEVMNGDSYNILKQAEVHVIGNCEEFWPEIDDSKQICLGHRTTGFSACQGDSGGSALQKHGDQWVVVGVTSFGADCITHGSSKPNVYVRVSAYLPWIKSIINQCACNHA